MSQDADEVISIQLLKKAFTSKYYPDLFAGEGTHDAALGLIAQLVPFTDDEEFLFEIVRSGLPDSYDGDTLEEIVAMVRSAIAKGFRENGPASMADGTQSMASAAVKLAVTAATELFHDRNRRSFISVPTKEGGVRTFPLNSAVAVDWLGGLWYATKRSALPAKAKSDALATLHASALYAGSQHAVAIRISRTTEAVYLDLGASDHMVVRIDGNGWEVAQTSPVKFLRPSTFGELPKPNKGGELSKVKTLLQLSEPAWHLVLAFIISALRPVGPYFCLLVDGEQGSGKSLLCSVLKRIIDPSLIDKLPLPGSDDQLFIQAKDSHLLVFDNASGMRNDISDALCRLATGGAVAKRTLYTNDDLHVLVQCNPFIINGIGDFVHRPDLLERAILLSLPTMPVGARRPEQQIFAELEIVLPSFLGRLFDIVSIALRDESATEPPREIRMADAARWLKAAEPATGLRKGTLLKAIENSQTISVIDRVRENSVFRALDKMLEMKGPFNGGVGVLHDLLTILMDQQDRSFPKTASHLSTQLQRLRPAMAKAGILVELKHKGREGRTVSICRVGQEGVPAKRRPPLL